MSGLRRKVRRARSGAAIQTVETDTGHLHCTEPIPKIRNKYAQKRNCANLHIPVSVSDLYSHARSAYSAAGNMWPILGIYKSLTDTWMQFSEKGYKNGIYVAMYCTNIILCICKFLFAFKRHDNFLYIKIGSTWIPNTIAVTCSSFDSNSRGCS